jgi:membrane protein DedA with SNARE-associated domain
VEDALRFLIAHGYAIVFAVALINQFGVPFPASPWLLAAGALARGGYLNGWVMLGLAMAASLFAHVVWYEAGRRSGAKILRLVCRVSLEPDLCVRKTENLFAARGPKALVLAHFIPGLVTVAQPLAGTLRMPRPRFVGYNLAGSLLWAGGFMGLGFVFSRQLAAVGRVALNLGGVLLVVAAAAAAAWIAWKLRLRRRILSDLRVARITPQELKRRLDAGEDIVVVDLRHILEVDDSIPGALRIPAEELEARHAEIPRDRDIVLTCS